MCRIAAIKEFAMSRQFRNQYPRSLRKQVHRPVAFPSSIFFINYTSIILSYTKKCASQLRARIQKKRLYDVQLAIRFFSIYFNYFDFVPDPVFSSLIGPNSDFFLPLSGSVLFGYYKDPYINSL